MAESGAKGSRSLEVLGLGWSLGWRIAAAFLAGYYADKWLGTQPFLTLLLAIAALTLGVRQLLTTLARDAGDGGHG